MTHDFPHELIQPFYKSQITNALSDSKNMIRSFLFRTIAVSTETSGYLQKAITYTWSSLSVKQVSTKTGKGNDLLNIISFLIWNTVRKKVSGEVAWNHALITGVINGFPIELIKF